MLLRLDPASDAPLFAQVAASVRADAAAGRLKPGDRLPSARDVAAALGVNLHTVLRAYQELRDDGVIELRRGRGAVVASAPDHGPLHEAISALVATTRRLDIPPATAVALLKEALR